MNRLTVAISRLQRYAPLLSLCAFALTAAAQVSIPVAEPPGTVGQDFGTALGYVYWICGLLLIVFFIMGVVGLMSKEHGMMGLIGLIGVIICIVLIGNATAIVNTFYHPGRGI